MGRRILAIPQAIVNARLYFTIDVWLVDQERADRVAFVVAFAATCAVGDTER